MGIGTLLFLGALSILGSVGVSSYQNQANREAQEKANKTNLDLQEAANEANLALQESANETNLALNKETNETNLQIARENREFELEMANTAHQREVADLKAAGLNPILSASGSGAPITSLSTATMNPGSVNPGSVNPGSVNPVGTDLSYLNSAIQSLTTLLLVGSMFGGSSSRNAMKLLNSPSLLKEFKLASRYF